MALPSARLSADEILGELEEGEGTGRVSHRSRSLLVMPTAREPQSAPSAVEQPTGTAVAAADGGTVLSGASRPCWSVGPEGTRCELWVPITEGAHLCAAGHTTLGLPLEGRRRPQQQGTLPAPVITARWLSYNARWQQSTRTVVLRRPTGAEKVLQQAAKTRPVLKYGAQPLAERTMVLTKHARQEMAAETISTDDLWRVIIEGEVEQRQPFGVVRVGGIDAKGRRTIVCWRFNVRQEIVIVTAFLDARACPAATVLCETMLAKC